MLKAKVAYAKGRDKVDENFEKLLRHVVDEIKDADTLKRAKLFMEAFMAFYKVHGPKD
jgi:CRISPR-associated protein Csm2